MNETKTEEILPRRTLKLYQGVFYGIGCGIGGSIFILLSDAIIIAGPGVLISLILGGILIFFTALNYSELSTSLPIAGGAYNFSKEGLGGFLAFIIGFFLWVANIAACSFSAQIFALVLNEFFIKFNISIPLPFTIIISILPILIISFWIFKTQKIAIKTLIWSTFFLIGIFILFIISGILISPYTNPVNFKPEFISSGTNFMGVLLSFLGLFLFFTSITSNLAYLNADLKNPSKSIPKTNMLAILISLIIYLLVTTVVLINIGNNPADFSESNLILADVLNNVLGLFGFYLMAIAALISTSIAINAALGSAVSVITALARDRYVPKKIKEVKKRSDMPALGLMLTVSISVIFTIFAGIGLAAETTNFIYFIGLAAVNYAAVMLRHKRKELDRPFKAPFFPGLPIFLFICFISFAIILGIFISPGALILGIITSIIGVVYYLLTIADRPSIVLTLAGIKFLLVSIVGIFIWLINNFSSMHPLLIFTNRVLIIICIFTIGTIFFDVIPLREMVYFLIKKVDKGKVAINIGDAQIIDLGKKRSKIIHYISIFIVIFQFISVACIFIIVYSFFNEIIFIDDIILQTTIIPKSTGSFIFISIIISFGITLFFSGIVCWYNHHELKSLGI